MSKHDGTLSFDTKIDTTGLQTGLSKIGNLAAAGLKTTTAILAGAATGIATLGGAAIKVGMDFEAGMSEVAAISGATGQELEALTEKAKEMGAQTKFSAGESAEAFQYMAMAGWKTEEMLNSIEGIMNLAAASGEDLATTSDIVTDAMTALGMAANGTTTVIKDGLTKEVSNATHFADVLAAASSNANTNVSLMGESFKYVAPVAGALGYSAEDLATALGLMANSGIKASQAGTALRSTLTRMAKPTKESQAAMDRLGVSITNADGTMKPFSETMADLREGFADLTEAEKAEYAAMLAGQEGMSGLLGIVNASDEDFEKLQNAIYDCDGAAEQMAETMMDNLAGAVEEFSGALETLGLEIYEGMQEPLKETVQYATTFIDRLMEAFNTGGMEGMVAEFGNILADIIGKVAEYAPSFIDMAVQLIENFCQGLKGNEALTDAASDLIVSLVEALASAGSQIWTTAIVLIGRLAGGIDNSAPEVVSAILDCITDITECLNDWTPDLIESGVNILLALVEGVVASTPLLLSHIIGIAEGIISEILKKLPEIVEVGVNVIIQLVEGIVGAIPQLITAITELVPMMCDALITAMPILLQGAVILLTALLDAVPVIIEQLLQALPDIIVTLVDFLVDSLPLIIDAAVQMLYGIIEAIPDIIDALVENLPQIVETTVNALVEATPQILQAAITLLMELVHAIPHIVTALIEAVPELVQYIIDCIVSLADGIIELGSMFIDSLWQGITSVWDSVVEWFSTVVPELIENIGTFFSELPGKVWEWLVGVVTQIAVWGISMKQKADEAASEAVNTVVQFFSELPYKIGFAIGFVLGTLADWGLSVIDWIVTTVPTFIDNIVQFFTELPGKIGVWLTNVVTDLIVWGVNLKNEATTAAMNMINSVVEWFSQLPAKIGVWLTNVITKVITWASNLKQKGIEAATSLVNAVVDGVSSLPGKMLEVGTNIVNGVWTGIQNAASTFTENVKNFFAGIVDGAKEALGIASPAKKVKKEVGVWIMPAVTQGMEETMPEALKDVEADMAQLTSKAKAAITFDSIQIGTPVVATANAKAAEQGTTINNYDNSITQSNDYHVPVVTPSETSKANREAARKLFGGVK